MHWSGASWERGKVIERECVHCNGSFGKKKKLHKHVTLMEQSVLHGSITCNSVFIQLPNAVNG